MAAYAVDADDLIIPAAVLTNSPIDHAEFHPGFVLLLRESPLLRWWISNDPYNAGVTVHRVTVRPTGIVYPGDAVPGEGSYKVTLDLAHTLPTVVMTRVENIDMVNGWAVITKGQHIRAYSPFITFSVAIEATT